MDGILCVYKPQNMTSFDVVARVRRILNAKVGHAGTLDPMATGILVLAINKATKALNYIGTEQKTYIAKLQLGTHTHTGDIWGDVIDTQSVPELTEDQVKEVLRTFLGTMTQRVPKVSAKKIDGRRSYDYVLKGDEVEQLYTEVSISNIELISFNSGVIEFGATVSNGTYIRTLCEDIAEKLGTIGTMSSLERTVVGIYTLSDAIKLEDVSMETPLDDVKSSIVLPKIVDESLSVLISHGKRIELDTQHDRVLLDGGDYFAVYERELGSRFKSVRGLW